MFLQVLLWSWLLEANSENHNWNWNWNWNQNRWITYGILHAIYHCIAHFDGKLLRVGKSLKVGGSLRISCFWEKKMAKAPEKMMVVVCQLWNMLADSSVGGEYWPYPSHSRLWRCKLRSKTPRSNNNTFVALQTSQQTSRNNNTINPLLQIPQQNFESNSSVNQERLKIKIKSY